MRGERLTCQRSRSEGARTPGRRTTATRSQGTPAARRSNRTVGQFVDGNEMTVEAVGHEARIMQHEIDHLDGLLLYERLNPTARKAALRRLREQQHRTSATDLGRAHFDALG